MENIYATYNPPKPPSDYLTIDDGEAAKFRIISEPYIFTSNYNGNISTKYAWIVWSYEDDAAKVLQASITTYRKIANIAADPEWGDPTEYDMKFTREGTGKDTVYHVTASPKKTSLDDSYVAAAMELDIEKLVKGARPLSSINEEKERRNVKRAEQDIVIRDLDEDEKIDLDEIPF